jgi:hypothetical protein
VFSEEDFAASGVESSIQERDENQKVEHLQVMRKAVAQGML